MDGLEELGCVAGFDLLYQHLLNGYIHQSYNCGIWQIELTLAHLVIKVRLLQLAYLIILSELALELILVG